MRLRNNEVWGSRMKEWSKDERFYPEASLFLEGLFESSS
jgi:hypothetical protein